MHGMAAKKSRQNFDKRLPAATIKGNIPSAAISVLAAAAKHPARGPWPVALVSREAADNLEEVTSQMFDKDSLDRLFEELRDEFELETDWEEIQRDAHLAVAYADAGVLGDQQGALDSRVVGYVTRHDPN